MGLVFFVFSPRGDLASVFFTKEGLASVLFREFSFQVVFRENSFFVWKAFVCVSPKAGLASVLFRELSLQVVVRENCVLCF